MATGTGGTATAEVVVGVEAEGRVVEVDHADAAQGGGGTGSGPEVIWHWRKHLVDNMGVSNLDEGQSANDLNFATSLEIE